MNVQLPIIDTRKYRHTLFSFSRSCVTLLFHFFRQFFRQNVLDETWFSLFLSRFSLSPTFKLLSVLRRFEPLILVVSCLPTDCGAIFVGGFFVVVMVWSCCYLGHQPVSPLRAPVSWTHRQILPEISETSFSLSLSLHLFIGKYKYSTGKVGYMCRS